MVFEVLPLAATVLFAMFLIPMTGVQTMHEISKNFATVYIEQTACLVAQIEVM